MGHLARSPLRNSVFVVRHSVFLLLLSPQINAQKIFTGKNKKTSCITQVLKHTQNTGGLCLFFALLQRSQQPGSVILLSVSLQGKQLMAQAFRVFYQTTSRGDSYSLS